MSEAETKPIEKKSQDVEPIKKKPLIEIRDLNDLKRVLIIAKGGDPDAIQAITNFMDLKNPTERANFMNTTIMLAVAQQNGFSKTYFPNRPNNAFALVSEVIATATMGYKSKKSDQLTQIIQQTPNLSEITAPREEIKRGIVDKILGRSKTE